MSFFFRTTLTSKCFGFGNLSGRPSIRLQRQPSRPNVQQSRSHHQGLSHPAPQARGAPLSFPKRLREILQRVTKQRPGAVSERTDTPRSSVFHHNCTSGAPPKPRTSVYNRLCPSACATSSALKPGNEATQPDPLRRLSDPAGICPRPVLISLPSDTQQTHRFPQSPKTKLIPYSKTTSDFFFCFMRLNLKRAFKS